MLRLLLCLLTLAFICPDVHAAHAFLPEIKPLPADASIELKRREAEWLVIDAAHLRDYSDELNAGAAAQMVGVPVDIHNPIHIRAAETRDFYKKCADAAFKLADAQFYRAKAYREEIKAAELAAGNPNMRAASDEVAAEVVEEKPATPGEKPPEVHKPKVLKATLADGTVIDGGAKTP